MSAYEVTGYGNGNTNRMVFSFYTDQDLSSLIKYKAFDNNQTFPALEGTPLATTLNEIFTRGETATDGSMIALIDTTNAAPSQTDWKALCPADGEENNPNWLEGDGHYVEQDGSILTATDQATYNMVIEVSHNCLTADDMSFELFFEYTYTVETAPTPVLKYNTGTEGVPIWDTMTPGTEGVLHCRADSGIGNLYANIPDTSTEDTVEAWVSTSLTGA